MMDENKEEEVWDSKGRASLSTDFGGFLKWRTPKLGFPRLNLLILPFSMVFGVHRFENSSCFMFLGHAILSTDGFSREELEG